MAKYLFLILSMIFCSQNLLALQDSIDSKIKNESGLQYRTEGSRPRADDVVGATFCNGILESGIKELNQIGISSDDLKNEVYCTVGDFDGNGYLDFAIWGIDKQRNKIPDYENYMVLFFYKRELIQSIYIKSEFPGCLLVYYAPRNKVGPNGEPISKNDALWLIGETNGYDDVSKGIVYIYNSKTIEFDKIQFGKE
jgi:hypothetical protein